MLHAFQLTEGDYSWKESSITANAHNHTYMLSSCLYSIKKNICHEK